MKYSDINLLMIYISSNKIIHYRNFYNYDIKRLFPFQ